MKNIHMGQHMRFRYLGQIFLISWFTGFFYLGLGGTKNNLWKFQSFTF